MTFQQSGKGTGKVQRNWPKLNPKDVHTEKQEKQLNPIIKIKYFKIPVNKDRERERNKLKVSSTL